MDLTHEWLINDTKSTKTKPENIQIGISLNGNSFSFVSLRSQWQALYTEINLKTLNLNMIWICLPKYFWSSKLVQYWSEVSKFSSHILGGVAVRVPQTLTGIWILQKTMVSCKSKGKEDCTCWRVRISIKAPQAIQSAWEYLALKSQKSDTSPTTRIPNSSACPPACPSRKRCHVFWRRALFHSTQAHPAVRSG